MILAVSCLDALHVFINNKIHTDNFFKMNLNYFVSECSLLLEWGPFQTGPSHQRQGQSKGTQMIWSVVKKFGSIWGESSMREVHLSEPG